MDGRHYGVKAAVRWGETSAMFCCEKAIDVWRETSVICHRFDVSFGGGVVCVCCVCVFCVCVCVCVCSFVCVVCVCLCGVVYVYLCVCGIGAELWLI